MTTLAEISAIAQSRPAARVKVPFADLGEQFATIGGEVMAAVREVLESSCYVLGPRVADFEADFARYVGAKYCIGVNSGTSALHLALIAAGVGAGDEVITVPMTFIATSWAISYVGARPVYVDVDPETYAMDASQVQSAITLKTKAILPVHLYGQCAQMDALLDISRKHGISVIEDAAQAHGARYKGKSAGSMGLCGCFSFYPGKNLGGYGEGGAVVTNDDAIAARVRRLRDHAQSQRYHHDEIGFNYRMNAIQGAVLGVKLKYLERWTEARRRLAQRYLDALCDLPLGLPHEAPQRRHVWHLFVSLVDGRDDLREKLRGRGIETGLHYPIPLHLQEAYRHLGYATGSFPVAERVARRCISLPLFAEMAPRQQQAVIDALRETFRRS